MNLIPANAKSWIDVPADSHFPIQNLPLGVGGREGDDTESVVTRIGDTVIDLCALADCGYLPEDDFLMLHSLMDMAQEDVRKLRGALYDLFRADNDALRDDAEACAAALIPADQVTLTVPTEIPQFVDFYAGIHHASNVGRMFRPDQPPLLPNYRHVPVGYNGRASSVIPSGAPIRRPKGQFKLGDAPAPIFAPTRELDFELELGFFVGEGNALGEPIPITEAENHILGYVLVNDWSARDVQRWEYQPLGPFLAKSFATSISPWIVLADALEPFRVAGAAQEPEPLEHLRNPRPGHFDIHLEVAIQTAAMSRPQRVTVSNAKYLYWSFAQLLTHQTSNGTNVEPGDLYASGTISGPEEGSFGSLLELTWRGTKPIRMEETGEERTFLEDGDTVIMSAYAEAPDSEAGPGYRIGFGELRNTVTG